MNHYANEEVMWQRLQDMQREAENRRLFAEYALPGLAQLVGQLGERTWQAIRRTSRRQALRVVETDRDGASRVA